MRLAHIRPYYNFAVGCLALLAATAPSFAQTRYTARVIEDQPYVTPWDYRVATPVSINDFGEVVGNSFAVNGGHRGFHWAPDGQWTFLTDDPALQYVPPRPSSINNNGTISGAAIRGSSASRAAVWQNPGSMPVLLSTVGYVGAGCYATNVSQLHVGFAGEFFTHGVVWNARGEVIQTVFGQSDLPGGHARTSLNSVNDRGLCLGNSFDDFNGGIGFVYDAATRSFTVLDSSGYYLASANQINGNGFSVGFVQASGTNRRESVVWSPANVRTTIRPDSVAKAINDFQVVVGDDYDIRGDAATPYVWDARYGARDLNDLLTGSPDFRLRRAFGINNYGQIVASGTYKGHDAGILLTPVDSIVQNIAPSSVRITTRDPDGSGGFGPERDVVGIACDNNAGTLAEDRNCLVLTLPAGFEGARIRAQVPLNGGSFGVSEGGKITFFPPDEFNENQSPENGDGDLTEDALRPVNVTLFVEKADGSKYIAKKEILLARPPVVLVHGINDTPDWWDDLMLASSYSKRVRIPYARVDHSMDAKGNGPVEKASKRLQDKINETLQQIRDGIPLPEGDYAYSLVLKEGRVVPFDDYENKHLAVRRADVVAWSYGGVVTRWYLGSRGSQSPESAGWYRLASPFAPSYIPPPTDYATQKNVRKVITLGSMWRGVPLCNYLNEARATDDRGIDFTRAPLDPLSPSSGFGFYYDLGALVIRGLGTMRLNETATGYSTEVMAIDSPWLCWLNYGSSTPVANAESRPFQPDVQYGSVAGDDNNYIAAIDPYNALDAVQSPSWFPYLKLEVGKGINRDRNYTDGVVPVWSAAIPGSYKIAACSHGNYAKNSGTQDYVLQWLNRTDLPLGARLNDIWNDADLAQVSTQDGARTWTFHSARGKMAPYPQSDLYEQRDRMGRIHGDVLGEIRSGTSRQIGDSLNVVWETRLKTRGQLRIWALASPNLIEQLTEKPIFDVKDYRVAQSHAITIPNLSSKLQANRTYYFDVTSELPYAPDPDISVRSRRVAMRLGANQVIVAADKAISDREGFKFTAQVFNNTGSPLLDFRVTKVLFSPEYQMTYLIPQSPITVPAGASLKVEVGARNKIAKSGAVTVVISGSYKDSSGKTITVTSPPQRIREGK